MVGWDDQGGRRGIERDGVVVPSMGVKRARILGGRVSEGFDGFVDILTEAYTRIDGSRKFRSP